MAFVPAPNIVMVEVRALLDSQQIENRFMVDALTAVTPTNLDDITNFVSVWAQAHYFPLLPNAVSLREVVGTDLTTQNGQQHTIVPSGSVIGGTAQAPMPNETSFCVSLHTGSRGRSARGRSYVLALGKGQVAGNIIDSGYLTSMVAAYQELIDTLSTNGFALVVVSYRANKVPRPGGPVYFPITTAVATDNIVDSMRRRKPGVGS